MSRQIVLASGSPYRSELLRRLRLPFDVVVPDVDEAPHPGESPRDTALRLAGEKATRVSRTLPAALVIGSDQVAEIDGEPLGKPGHHEAALAQLSKMQGRVVVFHTAVALALRAGSEVVLDCVPTVVRMRSLPLAELDAYLRLDQPYDCAGAAKIESLGIALVESVESSDPTALIGLPLIRLTAMLDAAGVRVLAGA
jgi:septum formation protein